MSNCRETWENLGKMSDERVAARMKAEGLPYVTPSGDPVTVTMKDPVTGEPHTCDLGKQYCIHLPGKDLER